MKFFIKLIGFVFKSVLFLLKILITVLFSEKLHKSIEEDRKRDRDYNYYYNNKTSYLD